MKLNPPGTSSDLEEARAIARRLTRGVAPAAAAREEQAGYVAFVSERAGRGAPRRREPEPVAVEAQVAPEQPFAPAFARSEPQLSEPAIPEPPFGEPSVSEPAFPEPEAFVSAFAEEPADVSVDSLVEGLVDEPAVLTAELSPPTWGEIVEQCRGLAQAYGALLIDAGGAPLESCGEWPPAGVRAVAAKLMPLVEKKQGTSPGAAVSVRLGDRILTAWPISHGADTLTIAFIADLPVAGDVRQDVEAEVARGPMS